MRTTVERVRALELGWRPVDGPGTTEAAAQMPEIWTLPVFATTRTTETRWVGGRTEVEPRGGSCSVVVVEDVDVVVDEVVVDEVVAPGIVVDVVVEVEVVVEVVVVKMVVVVGKPVIRTTGGCTVTATITRSSWICSSGMLDSCATQVVTDALLHDAGWVTHLEAGRRPRPLERGRESTKLR
jgi:hypothetical protein